jgi:hypothetical protein
MPFAWRAVPQKIPQEKSRRDAQRHLDQPVVKHGAVGVIAYNRHRKGPYHTHASRGGGPPPLQVV